MRATGRPFSSSMATTSKTWSLKDKTMSLQCLTHLGGIMMHGQSLVEPQDTCRGRRLIAYRFHRSTRRGERIYHTPDQSHYADIDMSINNGRRLFCTREEAEAAGWRRPSGDCSSKK